MVTSRGSQIQSAVLGRMGIGSRTNAQLGSGVGWSFSFEPSVAITAARIDKLGVDIRSFREPLKKAVKDVMTKSFQANFASGGRPTPWEPWSPGTIDVMSNMRVDGDLMVRSGNLQRVVGQINIWTFTEVSATVRDLPSSVWYGKIHQSGYGGSGGGKGGFSKFSKRGAIGSAKGGARDVSAIPARPFILIQDEDVDAIHQVFMKWLEERVNRSWAGR